ncbi:type II secretion system F family protein [Acrocarpospora catenulata]|uniref:type II secretion system F family protein n=1 Tax=Acrocarpospora catenulata TaxID=2836182 RepID=UPI0027E139E5|nr:type II secretion system F family protein [Acrocarpospora catenulata]
MGAFGWGLVATLTGGIAGWLWFGPTRASARLTAIASSPTRPWPSLLYGFRRTRPAKQAAAWRTSSIELCQAIAAELATGRTAGDALSRAITSTDFPDPTRMTPVLAAARDGGDIATALRQAAPPTGGEGLLRLSSCWHVSTTIGGGLTTLIERVATSLRDLEAHRQDISAQLAGPRATARLLAALPALGLLLAAALGMQPLPFLFTTPAGLACLILGLTLNALGLRWTNHLVTKAEQTCL